MNHINLFLTYHKDHKDREVQINMLLFKTYLFFTRGKYITKHFKNNSLKIISPTWNDEFELLDGSYSVSDIQNYIDYIIKNMKH